MHTGIIKFTEGLKRTKWQENVRFVLSAPDLFDLEHESCPVLLAAPGSQNFKLGQEPTSSAPLVLRSPNYTPSFPGSPAYRWQIVELLSLHNHMSQYLITNMLKLCMIYICVYTRTRI